MSDDHPNELSTRRRFLQNLARGTCLLGLGGLGGVLASAWSSQKMVWQIDPFACTQCGRCSTECVLQESAVKVVNHFEMCAYCDLCFGYFQTQPNALTTAAENLMCPTDALKRKLIEEPYYEYTIDEDLCIACGKCVEGCEKFGNASLYLQVRHDRCLNCPECAIAIACPANAFIRVPADQPYVTRSEGEEAVKDVRHY